MQQPSRALKRVHPVFVRHALVLVATCVVASGCGASWTGAWGGTADLGPVNAHELTLTLSDKDSRIDLMDSSGETRSLAVCSRKVVGAKITLVVDTGRADCSAGKDAKRLRLDGVIGAGVIHGDLYRGQQRVGFFRAFRAPAPDAPHGSMPTPQGSTAAPKNPASSTPASTPRSK